LRSRREWRCWLAQVGQSDAVAMAVMYGRDDRCGRFSSMIAMAAQSLWAGAEAFGSDERLAKCSTAWLRRMQQQLSLIADR